MACSRSSAVIALFAQHAIVRLNSPSYSSILVPATDPKKAAFAEEAEESPLIVKTRNRHSGRCRVARPRGDHAQVAQAPTATLGFAPADFSIDEAIATALQQNPELTTFRAQRGISAANVVIARTYPYNPVLNLQPTYVTGPSSESITNSLPTQASINLPLEIRHQRAYRREEALALLNRTEWEILAQETALSIRVARAYWGVQYRADKLRLLDVTAQLNQQTADQVRRLVEQGRLRGADWILARTEIDDTRAMVHMAKIALSVAQAELTRSIGATELGLAPRGKLTLPAPAVDQEMLTQTALARRPDLRARQIAIAEAEARLKLTVADRFGNPVIGPYYQVDQNRLQFVGGQVILPIPVLNVKRGEILQKEAELAQFSLAATQIETQVKQDVAAARARWQSAKSGVEAYEKDILPNLRESLLGIEKLFAQGEPGVDVLRLIDMRRKSLRADDGYLDALWELSQAHADLAAAAGDPSVAVPGLRCVDNPR